MERTLDSLRRMDLWVSGEGRLVYACFSFFFFNSRLRILGELCNASCQCQCHYSLHSRIRVAISEALETLKAEVALSDIPSPPFLFLGITARHIKLRVLGLSSNDDGRSIRL